MPTSAAICGWLRPATAVAGAVFVTACTASTGTSATGSHPAAQQPVAAVYACGLASFREPGPPHGTIVLGVVSIGDEYWPTARVHQGWWRCWQKDALWIRAGHQAVTITVPRAWRTRAAITWGVNVGIVSTLRLPGCPSAPGTWNGYAGGFYLRSSSACVPLESPANKWYPNLADWNGHAWQQAKVTGNFILAHAVSDGHGGLWVTTGWDSTGIPPHLMHLVAGHFTPVKMPKVGGRYVGVYGLAAIPGSTSIWGAGTLSGLGALGLNTAVILKYGRCRPPGANYLQPAQLELPRGALSTGDSQRRR